MKRLDEMDSAELADYIGSSNYDEIARRIRQECPGNEESVSVIASIANKHVKGEVAARIFGREIAATFGFLEPEVQQEDHRSFVDGGSHSEAGSPDKFI